MANNLFKLPMELVDGATRTRIHVCFSREHPWRRGPRSGGGRCTRTCYTHLPQRTDWWEWTSWGKRPFLIFHALSRLRFLCVELFCARFLIGAFVILSPRLSSISYPQFSYFSGTGALNILKKIVLTSGPPTVLLKDTDVVARRNTPDSLINGDDKPR